MAVEVSVYVEDPTTALLTYTTIRLYRATTPGADFTSLVATAPLVANTRTYVITDSSGASGNWYRYTLYNPSGPLETEQSNPFQAGVSLSWLRMEAAIRAGAGFRGLAEGGNLSSLIDSRLLDSGVDENFLAGCWVLRPGSSDANRVRRLTAAPFSTSDGRLTIGRPWISSAPTADSDYEIYMLLPPRDDTGVSYSWNRAVRDGLSMVTFEDEILITGNGTATSFSLAAYAEVLRKDYIRRVLLRTTDTNGNTFDQDMRRNGHWWNVRVDDRDMRLELGTTVSTSETIVIEYQREDAALYLDTDVTLAPSERAIRAATVAAFRWLNRDGKYEMELRQAALEWERHSHGRRPGQVMRW